MRNWIPKYCPDMRNLLEYNQAAYEYFYNLPPEVRNALRRHESVASITSFAEMQSFAADELENI